jgi:hypothetical protein
MRTQMLRHLGSLMGPSARLGGEGTRLLFAHRATQDGRSPPPEFSWREYAIFLLSMAAEIEHSLMVQYLYAAWSLGGPDVPAPHREEVTTWQRIVLGVAKEEMGHLITVQNLLHLLGGPIHLDREDFPWISGFYPYAFTLEPATRASVAKYVVAESPETWPDSVTPAEKAEIEQLATIDAGMQVGRVGVLYGEIIDLVSDPQKLQDSLFRGDTYPHQAAFDDWGRGYAAGARGATATTTPDVLVLRAGNRAQAVIALKEIAEQGEATQFISADREDSHFSRFLKVWRGINDAADWSPSLSLPIDPAVPGLGADARGATVIRNPESVGWGTLFNLRYRMLLTWLAHALALGTNEAAGGSPGRRGLALNRVFNEMYFLKSIAGLLTRRPLDVDPKTPAGPPFQMPYSLNFPSDEQDFWRLHFDLLDASREVTSRLPVSGADGAAFLAALREAEAQSRRDIGAILSEGIYS